MILEISKSISSAACSCPGCVEMLLGLLGDSVLMFEVTGVGCASQVFFCSDELLDFKDVLQIASENELVEIPLEAKLPSAKITVRMRSPGFELSIQAVYTRLFLGCAVLRENLSID